VAALVEKRPPPRRGLGRRRPCCVLLLVRSSEDDGVVEFGRLLELYVRAQGITEVGDVELDLLVLHQRLVAAGELHEAGRVVVHVPSAAQPCQLLDRAGRQWRSEA
jgi:hypothetical protein